MALRCVLWWTRLKEQLLFTGSKAKLMQCMCDDTCVPNHDPAHAKQWQIRHEIGVLAKCLRSLCWAFQLCTETLKLSLNSCKLTITLNRFSTTEMAVSCVLVTVWRVSDVPCRRHNVRWCRQTYCRDHSTVRRFVSDYFQTTTLWIRRYQRSRSSR